MRSFIYVGASPEVAFEGQRVKRGDAVEVSDDIAEGLATSAAWKPAPTPKKTTTKKDEA